MRQYVAYQKEIVVLSPPTAYAPNTPAAQTFAANIQPSVNQVLQQEHGNPALRTQPWSTLPARATVTKMMVAEIGPTRKKSIFEF